MQRREKQFIKIYDNYADAIFRHCYFRVSNKELAENLTQETFMRAWKYLLENTKVKNIKALLYKIASNLIIDSYRKKKELSLDNLLEDGLQFASGDDKKIVDKVELKHLVESLDDIDEKYREIILMRFIDDLKPKEIAEALELEVNVVSVRLHRGLKKLQEVYDTA